MSSNVTHPTHYNTGKIEVIEIIEDQNLNFHRGNAVKYICRAGRKNPEKEIEDLEKAVWYLQRAIEVLKPSNEKKRPNDMNETSLDFFMDFTVPHTIPVESNAMKVLEGHKWACKAVRVKP